MFSGFLLLGGIMNTTAATNKTRQQKYRDDMKAQGMKLTYIPIQIADIELALELTSAENERSALQAIIQRGLEKQRDLLDNSVTSNELITAINREREKLQQEIAEFEKGGKQWRKNQRILAKLELLQNLQPNAPPIAETHAAG
jgi:hypothetical protein